MFLCVVAPQLASPFAGLLVDRVRRRSLLLVVNPLTALAVLPLLAIDDARDVWIIYAVALAYGASYTLLAAGQSALLHALLEPELLAPANAALQTVREALRLIAPVAGAGLYTLAGGAAVALLDAATFLAATAALFALKLREPKPARDPEPRAIVAGAPASGSRGSSSPSSRCSNARRPRTCRVARSPPPSSRWPLSIALGAALVALIDYRFVLLVQAFTVGAAGVYLLTRMHGPWPPWTRTSTTSWSLPTGSREPTRARSSRRWRRWAPRR